MKLRERLDSSSTQTLSERYVATGAKGRRLSLVVPAVISARMPTALSNPDNVGAVGTQEAREAPTSVPMNGK